MKQLTGISLLASGLFALSADGQSVGSHYSLLDNLNEKLSGQNLADRIALGQPEKKFIPIVAGAEFLLKYLEESPQFKRDHLWGRLAHPHPISTIAFREEDNPSTHVLFRKLPDGSLQANIHLDGNGPQKVFPHLDEFFFHKLTFRDTNQDSMHDNLQRAFARQIRGPGEAFITRRERTMLYVHETLGLQPVAAAFSNTVFRHYAHQLVWKTEQHYEPMVNRFEGSLIRRTLKNSFELGVANWRQEDTRYKPSGERGFKNRVRTAAVNTFVVPTPAGKEFAYGRFAAIIGTTAVIDAWHPWRAHTSHPNYARQATFGLALDPLARSMWTEFWPDIRRQMPFHEK